MAQATVSASLSGCAFDVLGRSSCSLCCKYLSTHLLMLPVRKASAYARTYVLSVTSSARP